MSVAYAQLPDSQAKPDTIMRIQGVLSADNLDQFGVQLAKEPIVGKVGENLAEWRYPFKTSEPFTHRLEISLGKVSRQSSPVGFSFSSGNSDPRSADFQKADVLPISCRLRKISDNSVLGEQETPVAAHDLQKDAGVAKLTEKLSDAISTVCFDVLDELKLPAMGSGVKVEEVKPTWIPNVRIEAQEIPALDSNGKPSGVQAVESNSETRKQIIIHNQGTPLIIKFGHERQ
jgi:hypothetical protein